MRRVGAMSQSMSVNRHAGMGAAAPGIPGSVVALLLTVCVACVLLVVGWQVISPWLPAVCSRWGGEVLPGVLFLEWWRPAEPAQPLFSPGLLVDLLWFLTF